MKTERNIFFTCNMLPEKEKRNLSIFEIIRKRGLISKPEISKITGINIVSVSNYIENYIAKQLVSEHESDKSSGGRKPELIELNKKDRFVIGVDVGPSHISATLTSLEAKAIGSATAPRKEADNARDTSASLMAVFEELVKKTTLDTARIAGMGIALPDSHLIDLKEDLEKRFKGDIFIGGPALCAAFAERWSNKDADSGDTLYIHSDLGRGIAIKNSECFGAIGNMGEIVSSGNSERSDDGGSSFSEELRYLQPWSPALGAVAIARAEVLKGVGTKIVDFASGRIENISLDTVVKAAKAKDKIASDILRNIGTNLGVRIAYLVNIFSPRVVIIGGGIEAADDIVLDPILQMVKRFAFAKQASRVMIMPGRFGSDAVCIGAASLAVRELFLRA